MDVKISIIIPVYNVEEYLEDCVHSVLNQTYTNYEIILVNDGSTDNSGAICESFKSDIIKVIHKENRGLSDARNVGTAAAIGDYITWVDGDDTIHKDCLKILLDIAEASGADLSACEFLSYREHENIIYPKESFVVREYQGMDALKMMLWGELHGTSACGLLIKSNLAKKHLFPYKKFHEDDLTTYIFFMNANKVAYTNQPLYFYLQRAGSIMHKPFSQIDIDELNAADEIYEKCCVMGKEYVEAAMVKKVADYCQVLFKFEDLKNINKHTYKRINDFLGSNIFVILGNRHISKKTKFKVLLYKLRILKYAKLIWKEIHK